MAGRGFRLERSFDFQDHPRPVILIHGMWSDARIFKDSGWAEAFREEGFSVCTVTLDGRGLTERIRTLEYVVRVLKPEGELTLLGHSMGGLIAQAVAPAVGARNVALVSSAVPHRLGNLSRRFLKRAGKYLPSLLFKPTTMLRKEDFVRLVGNNGMDKKTIERVYSSLQPESSRVALRVGCLGYPVPRLLSRTLVVGGSKDLLLPRRAHVRLARYHGAELKVFDTGHVPMFENLSGTVLDSIVSWLRHNPAIER